MTDNELINKIKKGDASAFRELVESHQDQVVNTCYGFLQNKEDAEDVAQEVFVEIYKSIAGFHQEAKLSTWFYRIAVNRSLNKLKARNRKKWLSSFQTHSESETAAQQIADSQIGSPEADLEQQERRAILQHAVASLVKNQKIAFTLSKYEGMNYREIAEVMGTTISAVDSLLIRAKKNLQKKLYIYYKR